MVSLSLVRGRPCRYSLPGALTDSPVPADLIISKRNFLSLYALVNCYADQAVFDCWEILDKIHIWSRVLDFRNFVLNCFFIIEKKFHRKFLEIQIGVGERKTISIKFLLRFWLGFGDLCWFMTPPALWWTAWCNACWPGWTGCDCCCCCCCPIFPPYAENISLFFKIWHEILGTRWFSMLSY